MVRVRKIGSIVGAAFALALICGVVVAALAVTNDLTKDTIAAQLQAATEQACREVLQAESYTLLEQEWSDGVNEVYEAKDGDTLVGYVVKTTTNGRASGLVVMTGVTPSLTVSGVSVVDDGETAGYVDKVTDGGLLDRLQGVTDTADVDGVSQATKTSNGIKKGVDLALKTVQEVTAGE